MFKDRYDAASQLATHLSSYKNNPDVVIVAIPRGGLELGFVLARELKAPLDVMLSKKIGYPGNPEYAIGAVSLESVLVDTRSVHLFDDLDAYVASEIQRIRETLKKKYQEYRGNRPPLDLAGKIVIVTDDGAATGSTLAVTLDLIRKSHPRKLIVAIPVAPPSAVKALGHKADEVVCLVTPHDFRGVGQFYENFEQVSDEEALRLLQESAT